MMLKYFEHKRNRKYEIIEKCITLFYFINSLTKESHPDKLPKPEGRIPRRRNITMGPRC
jgi:hypothetical protein